MTATSPCDFQAHDPCRDCHRPACPVPECPLLTEVVPEWCNECGRAVCARSACPNLKRVATELAAQHAETHAPLPCACDASDAGVDWCSECHRPLCRTDD